MDLRKWRRGWWRKSDSQATAQEQSLSSCSSARKAVGAGIFSPPALPQLQLRLAPPGYVTVGLFTLGWIVSIAVYKGRRFDSLEFGD